jgi:enoyl-CoA hydratase/carnithine racemase
MAVATNRIARLVMYLQVAAIVLTGSERAFAAGADIKEMASREVSICRRLRGETNDPVMQFADVYGKNMFSEWAELTTIKKPVRKNSLISGAHCSTRCVISCRRSQL